MIYEFTYYLTFDRKVAVKRSKVSLLGVRPGVRQWEAALSQGACPVCNEMESHLGQGGHGSSCDSPSLLSELWEVEILLQVDPAPSFRDNVLFISTQCPGQDLIICLFGLRAKGREGKEAED